MTNSLSIDKGISDIVGCLTDPILVFPGGWGDSLPDWLKHAITLQRLVMNIGMLKGEEPTGTDAEACAYLMTVSLTQPIDSDWTQIYLYVATQTYRKWGKGEMPADSAVNSLTDYQASQLKRLKHWLYERRVQARQERERAERQEEKQQEIAQRKAERPVLFDF